MTTTKKLLSKADVTRIFGISMATLNNLIPQGLPVAVQGKGGQRSLFDEKEVRVYLEANTKSHNIKQSEAKLRKLEAEAALAELELSRELGTVVPIEDAIRIHADDCTRIRTRFLALPSKKCHELANETSPKIIERILEDEIREILTELSTDLAKKLTTQQPTFEESEFDEDDYEEE